VSCVDFRNKITYLLRMVVIQSMIIYYAIRMHIQFDFYKKNSLEWLIFYVQYISSINVVVLEIIESEGMCHNRDSVQLTSPQIPLWLNARTVKQLGCCFFCWVSASWACWLCFCRFEHAALVSGSCRDRMGWYGLVKAKGFWRWCITLRITGFLAPAQSKARTVFVRYQHWDHGIESHWRYGYLCPFILCLCCPLCR
jgi:hypothetical protein